MQEESDDVLEEYGFGEEGRGAGISSTPAPPAQNASDLLRELFSKSPKFREYAERLRGKSRPSPSPSKARDWNMSFMKQGVVGTTETITCTPRCRFVGEKFFAMDDASPPNSGTRVVELYVGQKPQFISGPTSDFVSGKVVVGMSSCPSAISMSVTVEFLKDCHFYGELFGKAYL